MSIVNTGFVAGALGSGIVLGSFITLALQSIHHDLADLQRTEAIVAQARLEEFSKALAADAAIADALQSISWDYHQAIKEQQARALSEQRAQDAKSKP